MHDISNQNTDFYGGFFVTMSRLSSIDFLILCLFNPFAPWTLLLTNNAEVAQKTGTIITAHRKGFKMRCFVKFELMDTEVLCISCHMYKSLVEYKNQVSRSPSLLDH